MKTTTDETRPNYLTMLFGTDLRAERRARGLSQEQLAAQLGVDPTACSRWEAGDRFPRPDHLLTLRAWFGGAAQVQAQ